MNAPDSARIAGLPEAGGYLRGESQVPEELTGCWRRNWIRFADGTVDDTTQVFWLQHGVAMVDIRIPASQPVAAGRTSFAQFDLDELAKLADSESSSGHTACTPVDLDPAGVRRATAEWFTRDQVHDPSDGIRSVAFQPVTAYPEPGLLAWSGDGSVMVERAPSGDYIEEWSLVPGSRETFEDEVRDGGVRWFRTGNVAALVRDRRVPVPRPARLQQLVAECDGDRASMEALLDCEFSVAVLNPNGGWEIVASTLPWRKGVVL